MKNQAMWLHSPSSSCIFSRPVWKHRLNHHRDLEEDTLHVAFGARLACPAAPRPRLALMLRTAPHGGTGEAAVEAADEGEESLLSSEEESSSIPVVHAAWRRGRGEKWWGGAWVNHLRRFGGLVERFESLGGEVEEQLEAGDVFSEVDQLC